MMAKDCQGAPSESVSIDSKISCKDPTTIKETLYSKDKVVKEMEPTSMPTPATPRVSVTNQQGHANVQVIAMDKDDDGPFGEAMQKQNLCFITIVTKWCSELNQTLSCLDLNLLI